MEEGEVGEGNMCISWKRIIAELKGFDVGQLCAGCTDTLCAGTF